MQLEHSFTIPADVDGTWNALLDLERVAPCLPGARIESVDNGVYHGAVDVKVGPISLTYRGTAEFTEKDVDTRRAVLSARTREARGSGAANAKITARLFTDASTVTRVEVSTDLDITGRPAQFGTGVLSEVGGRLLSQFADRMAVELARPGGEAPAPTATGPLGGTGLLRLAAGPVARRAALPLVGIVAVVAIVLLRRSRTRG